MYSLSIVIPAYNEECRLDATLNRVDAFIRAEDWNAEVVVIDDGSTDGTTRLVMRHIQDKPYLRLLQNHINRGKGFSLRRGVEASLGDIILLTDADLSVPMQEAHKLLDAIKDGGTDIAIGSRGVGAGGERLAAPWHRQICSSGFKLLVRTVLGLRFEDTQCGFKAFKRRAARLIFSRQRIERWGFDPEVLMLADRFCFVVKEIGVEAVHDDGSRLNVVRDSFQMFCEVLKIRYHLLFGMYSYPTPSYQTVIPASSSAVAGDSLGAASATTN
jgi:glycosyltransferase involved in cell wall biosynthesis